MSHVGKRPKERRGLRREEEEGLAAAPRRRLSPGGGATGPPARLGKLPRLGLGENEYGKDTVLGGSSGRRRPEIKGGLT